MMWNLLARLWSDEAGAVIAAEYLMLASLVAAGSASGMVAMRDAMVDEYKQVGTNIREIRQLNARPVQPPQQPQPAAVPTVAPQISYTFAMP